MSKRRRRWPARTVPFNRLTWNTRMDRTMTPQVWKWIRRNFPRIHVIYLQEVSNLAKARRVLGDDWTIVGDGTTYIAYRDRRYANARTRVRDIGFGSRHQRHLVGLKAYDKRARRNLVAAAVHTDPLGRGFVAAVTGARRRHVKQTRAIVAWLGLAAAADGAAIVEAGGDFNERFDHPVPDRLRDQTALEQLRLIGLRAAFEITRDARARLDDIFTRAAAFVKKTRRIQKRPPTRVRGAGHFDHDLVFVGSRIVRAPKRR